MGAHVRAGTLLTRRFRSRRRERLETGDRARRVPRRVRDVARGSLPGAHELVASVRAHTPVGCLSNTNPLHWERNFSRWPILDAFDFRYLSFELGHVKPDRELFDRVAELVPAPPDRVLFLDDNLLNIEGAREAGFQAMHVRGVDETRQ